MTVRRLKLRHSLSVIVVGLVLIFQNCAPTEMIDENSVESYRSRLPFAYEAQLDTVAHMSCSNIQAAVEPRTYFTFRMGAYNPLSGGIRFTEEYLDKTKYYNTTEKAQSLAASDLNAETRLNVALRAAANLDQIYKVEEFKYGEEIEAFLPPLDSGVVAGPVAGLGNPRLDVGDPSKKQYVQYFPGSHRQRLMEASLRFYKYENIVKDIRNRLSGGISDSSVYLLMGFAEGTDDLNPLIRRNGSEVTKGYGTGYRMDFGTPSGWGSAEARVITGLQEFDMTDFQPTYTTWNCPNNYHFVIIRPEDIYANKVQCAMTVDSPPTNTADPKYKAWRAIRRVLRAEDWFVDLDRHCVVPKRTGDYCYGHQTDTMTVQYATTANCTGGTCTCVDDRSRGLLCPHYVSVCIRE